MNEKESPNKPRHVRSTRKIIKLLQVENDETEDSDNNMEDEINEDNISEESEESDNENNNHEKKNLKKPHDLDIAKFKKHVPFWGGSLVYKKKQIVLNNTCTIDYFLYAFWFMSKINATFIENIPRVEHSNSIKQIIQFIENENWIKAKEVWILNIAKYSLDRISSIDFFGTQYDHFLTYIKNFQHHSLVQKCQKNCRLNGMIIRDDSDRIFFKRLRSKVNIYSCFTEKCDECGVKIVPTINFSLSPNFLFIESAFGDIYLKDLPKIIKIDEKDFFFVGTTLSKTNHFISVFDYHESLYVVDDLGQKMNSLKNSETEREIIELSSTVSIYCLANI